MLGWTNCYKTFSGNLPRTKEKKGRRFMQILKTLVQNRKKKKIQEKKKGLGEGKKGREK